MRIIIIATSDLEGGAARAMHRLHKGFILNGEDSKILCKTKSPLNHHAVQVSREKYDPFYKDPQEFCQDEIFQTYLDSNRTNLSDTIFSYSYPGWDLSTHELLQECDVINLHWVSRFQSPETIHKLIKLGKPIVWTLHDEWAYTGGCHYTAGCKNFKTDCSNCPQINSPNSILPFAALFDKMNLFSNHITVVAPSIWLSENAKQSKLFANSRVEHIPYSLETDVFKPIENARESLELPQDAFVICFGAEAIQEKRKGFFKLLEAFKTLNRNDIWRKAVESNKILFLIFGKISEEVSDLQISSRQFGFVHDDEQLARIYSASDLFVLPSLEDNLPNTILESMSCGTPVLSFATGGMVDVIREKENGYLANLEKESLSEKILYAFLNQQETKRMGDNARKFILENFKLETQAEKYQFLFKELLDSKTEKPLGEDKKYKRSIENYENAIQDEIGLKSLELLKRVTLLKNQNQYEQEKTLEESYSKLKRTFEEASHNLRRSFSDHFSDQRKLYEELITHEKAYSWLWIEDESGVNWGAGIRSELNQLQTGNFAITFSIPEKFQSFVRFHWQPMENIYCKVKLESVFLQNELKEMLPIDLNQVTSNGISIENGWVEFLRLNNIFSIPNLPMTKSLSITFKGNWEAPASWILGGRVEEIIVSKNKEISSIQNSKPYRLGNFLLRKVPFLAKFLK